jgi:hypothetical protein
MAGLLGGGGGPPRPPDPPQLEKPQVMPIKDPEADRQQAIREQARAISGKTTRRNTIIGSDDEGL